MNTTTKHTGKIRAKLKKKEDEYYLTSNNIVISTTDDSYRKIFNMGMKKLSLKNCQAIERGYDLDELADDFIRCPEDMRTLSEDREINSFKKGFQKAVELMGDKKFSEDDVIKIAEYVRVASQSTPNVRTKELFDEYQSLQQTEWDVEIEMDEEKEFIFDPAMGISQGHYLDKPKLDADGCLILKRI